MRLALLLYFKVSESSSNSNKSTGSEHCITLNPKPLTLSRLLSPENVMAESFSFIVLLVLMGEWGGGVDPYYAPKITLNPKP